MQEICWYVTLKRPKIGKYAFFATQNRRSSLIKIAYDINFVLVIFVIRGDFPECDHIISTKNCCLAAINHSYDIVIMHDDWSNYIWQVKAAIWLFSAIHIGAKYTRVVSK